MEGITTKLEAFKKIHDGLLMKQLALEIDLQATKIMMLKFANDERFVQQQKEMQGAFEKTKLLTRITMEKILDLENYHD